MISLFALFFQRQLEFCIHGLTSRRNVSISHENPAKYVCSQPKHMFSSTIYCTVCSYPQNTCSSAIFCMWSSAKYVVIRKICGHPQNMRSSAKYVVIRKICGLRQNTVCGHPQNMGTSAK